MDKIKHERLLVLMEANPIGHRSADKLFCYWLNVRNIRHLQWNNRHRPMWLIIHETWAHKRSPRQRMMTYWCTARDGTISQRAKVIAGKR